MLLQQGVSAQIPQTTEAQNLRNPQYDFLYFSHCSLFHKEEAHGIIGLRTGIQRARSA